MSPDAVRSLIFVIIAFDVGSAVIGFMAGVLVGLLFGRRERG